MVRYLKVFAYGSMIDVMWVFYILMTSRQHIGGAVIISMLMGIPAILGYMSIVDDRKMAVPYIFGLGFGTYLGMLVHDYIV